MSELYFNYQNTISFPQIIISLNKRFFFSSNITILSRQSEYFLSQGRPHAALDHLDEALRQRPDCLQVNSGHSCSGVWNQKNMTWSVSVPWYSQSFCSRLKYNTNQSTLICWLTWAHFLSSLFWWINSIGYLISISSTSIRKFPRSLWSVASVT